MCRKKRKRESRREDKEGGSMIARIFLGGVSLVTLAGAATAQANSDATTPPPTAMAQAAPAPDQGTPSGLADIVVTAQRRAEKLQDVPLTITALSGSQLAKQGISTVRDLQTVVSGFTYQAFGTAPLPAIRGVSTTLSAAGAENPNALYIDGIYYGVQSALLNDFADIDRIEVLKGPQGTLFGRNATGGAIQIFTKNPSFTPGADVTLEAGDYTGGGGSHSAAHISIKGFLTTPIIADKLAVSISGGYSYSPGFLTNPITGKGEGEFRKTSVRAKLLFTPVDNLKITLAGYRIQNDDGTVFGLSAYHGLSAATAYPGAVVASGPWQTLPGDGDTSYSFKLYGGSAKVELDLDPGVITSLTGYNNFRSNGLAHFDAAQAPLACYLAFACLRYNTAFRPTTDLSQEVNFASRDFGPVKFTTGLYYYHAKGGTYGYVLQDVVPGGVLVQDDSFDTKSYAGYGEATIKLADGLKLTGGLRYSHERIENANLLPGSARDQAVKFNSLTPRVSLIYELTRTLNLYATWSRGFKSGNSGASNNAAPVPFQPVRPEKLTSYEAGIKFASPGVHFNLSGFYYDYKNKQEQTFTGTSYFILNTGPVEIYGLDADMSVKLSQALTLSGTASYIPVAKYKDFKDAATYSYDQTATGAFVPISIDATGFRLGKAPRFTANGTLAYATDLGGGKFDASASVSYSGKSYLEFHAIQVPSYTTLSAQLGYRPADSHMRVSLYARNLTNKAYMVGGFASAAGFFNSYAPPREVGAAVNFSF
jgi:iron complex outermembrane receptor protein